MHGADLRFHFDNPLFEAALDLSHCRTVAKVTRVVKVLQIGPQLLQQFVGKS